MLCYYHACDNIIL